MLSHGSSTLCVMELDGMFVLTMIVVGYEFWKQLCLEHGITQVLWPCCSAVALLLRSLCIKDGLIRDDMEVDAGDRKDVFFYQVLSEGMARRQ